MDQPTFIFICIISGCAIIGIIWMIIRKLGKDLHGDTKDELYDNKRVKRIRLQWETDWEFEKKFQSEVLRYLVSEFIPYLFHQNRISTFNTLNEPHHEVISYLLTVKDQINKKPEYRDTWIEIQQMTNHLYNMFDLLRCKKEFILEILTVLISPSQYDRMLSLPNSLTPIQLNTLVYVNKFPDKFRIPINGLPVLKPFVYTFKTSEYIINHWPDGARFLNKEGMPDPEALKKSFHMRWEIDLDYFFPVVFHLIN